MMHAHFQKYLRAIVVLSFVGMLVTAYLIYQHYKDAGGSFCDINDFVNCDIVNKSTYAEIFGIPVSVLGFFAYGVFFFASLFFHSIERKIHSGPLLGGLTLFSGIGLLFSLYLTYIEFFVLYAVCIFCLTQQILIFIIFLLFISLWRIAQKSHSLS